MLGVRLALSSIVGLVWLPPDSVPMLCGSSFLWILPKRSTRQGRPYTRSELQAVTGCRSLEHTSPLPQIQKSTSPYSCSGISQHYLFVVMSCNLGGTVTGCSNSSCMWCGIHQPLHDGAPSEATCLTCKTHFKKVGMFYKMEIDRMQ